MVWNKLANRNIVSLVLIVLETNCDLGCTMKLFQNVQKIYEQMGINSSELNPNHSCWNIKTALVLLVLIQFITSTAVFFFFKADSVGQHANSFHVMISASACLVFVALSMWKMADLQKLIDKLENFVDQSKWEEMSFILIFIVVIITWLYFIWIREYRLESKVHRTQCENGTNVRIDLFFISSTECTWCYVSSPIHHCYQLPDSWLRQWIILLTVFYEVSNYFIGN